MRKTRPQRLRLMNNPLTEPVGTGRKWIDRGGNFLFSLLIFVILIDPVNTIFRLKDVLFVLLVGYCAVFYKPSVRYVPQILAVLAMMVVGYLSGEIQGNTMDNEFLVGCFKSIAMLVLLLWVPRFNVLDLSKVPVLTVTFLLVILYIAVCSSEAVEFATWLFTEKFGNPLIMSTRHFLGFKLYGIYLKSIVAFSFVAAFYYNRLFNERRGRITAIFASTIITFCFATSGTRMTMLLPFVFIGIASYRRIQKTRYFRYLLYPFIGLAAAAFLGLVLMLATEKGEASNVVKFAHLTSYAELFSDHPEYLLIGQGPATSFYSIGFASMTMQTEWTYLELVRNYGLGSLLIIYLLCYPLPVLWRYRYDNERLSILIAYCYYLMTGGTNPLLFSSTGMISIVIVYSYISRLSPPQGKLSTSL